MYLVLTTACTHFDLKQTNKQQKNQMFHNKSISLITLCHFKIMLSEIYILLSISSVFLSRAVKNKCKDNWGMMTLICLSIVISIRISTNQFGFKAYN